MWHDEAERFFDTGELDPSDRCLCSDCKGGDLMSRDLIIGLIVGLLAGIVLMMAFGGR